MYGDALPTRLNPDGSGRNMSLFLVMRRYVLSNIAIAILNFSLLLLVKLLLLIFFAKFFVIFLGLYIFLGSYSSSNYRDTYSFHSFLIYGRAINKWEAIKKK